MVQPGGSCGAGASLPWSIRHGVHDFRHPQYRPRRAGRRGQDLAPGDAAAEAGATRTRGSLQRGTTVSDFDPQEKRLQHSLDTAICSLDYRGVHINVIDTPGYAGLSRQGPVGARGGGGGSRGGERRERRGFPDAAPHGVRARARTVPSGHRQQDRQPRGALRGGARGAARGVRARVPAAQPARRRRRCRGGLFLSAARAHHRLLLGRGGAHPDHRPGSGARRAAHGAVPGAGRGALAGAAAQPF